MTTAIRLLLPYVRPYRRALMVGGLAMLGEVATALLTPVPVKLAFDLIIRPIRGRVRLDTHISASDFRTLAAFGSLLVAIAVLDGFFTYVDLRQTARVAQLAVTDLRRALFAHLQQLSLSFHQHADTRLGDLQLRLSSDVQALQDLIGTALSNVATNAATAIGMVILLTLIDFRLGAILLASSIPVYLLSRHYRTRLREVTRKARRQEGRVSSMLSETLGAAKLVQAFGREREEARRLHHETSKGLDLALEASEYQARVQPLVALTTSLVTALMLLFGAVLVMRRNITVGHLTMVLAYSRGTFSAIRQLAKLSTQTQKAAVAAERLSETFAQVSRVVDPPNPKPLPPGPLSLEFDRVTFGYSDGRPVVRDLDWKVEAGSIAALVGPTGAGKSTLLNLAVRFYDVSQGSVRLGGVDVRELSLAELRSKVTLILQESLLLRDTVWNNIAYGRPDATEREILAAAEAAGVTAILDGLEDGFDTIISERGASLSGGQKQCVAIARAMLRDSPVVIMDEPTSSLDAATEQLVIQGIRRLVQGRTAVIIAHRFATIQLADSVAVMEGGRVIESGSPADLLESGSVFARLSRIQGMPA